MSGDSLAEQPNSPEKKESLESISPQVSQEEPKIAAQESLDLNVPQPSAQQADTLEIQEIESISPEVELPEANNSEIQESLEGRITPEVFLVEANTSETQAIREGPIYPNVSPVEANNLEIQESLETIYPEVFPAEANTSEIEERREEPIYPNVSLAEANTSETQTIREGTISPNLSLPETNTSETQESLRLEIPLAVREPNDSDLLETPESNTPEISREETETKEIQLPPESDALEILLEETDTEEIQETPESSYPQKSYRSAPQFTSEPLTSSSANRLKIFITGASGCIGHYIASALIQETDHELYLLVRNPGKLQFDYKARPGINIIKSDIKETFRYEKVLKTVDCVVLAATAWGGQQEVLDVNVFKTLKLLSFLDPKVCKQVIYFSTASVLDRNNQLLKEANELGTDYIRSKYECLSRISKLAIAPQVTTLFPTLVLGGDANHPYSHISSGLPGLKKWIKYIRFFKADGSFHFLHARDIAKVVLYLVENPPKPKDSRWLVLGNPEITVNQAVEEACAYLRTSIFFRLNLSPWLANLLIYLFKIKMAAWDRFCLDYRHFTYQNPVNPETFGLPVYCRTFRDVLRVSGINGGEKTVEPVNNYRLPLDDRESGAENDK